MMSNISGDERSFSSGNTGEEMHRENKEQQPLQKQFHGGLSSAASAVACNGNGSSNQQQQQQPDAKKKRNLPGTPGKFNYYF